MTQSAVAESIFVTELVHSQARQAVQEGTPLGTSLPPELRNVVRQFVKAASEGKTVTIGTLPQELSTTEAARQLGMSRPTLMKLVHNEEIPAHKVGSHTRLHLKDVQEFQKNERRRQLDAFDKLREIDDELESESFFQN
ncbi:helix-turn-helix domain-containing protein [Corynebacterium doosanense]|uniref:Excisionase n=1 Tax=Corynebacterium doosanense CAU 212 = DSM 45436 TaxID=558173 RepID=A0A097IIL9_9CORY|nr:helix-turn-helix domain-containing protein [Corynebacterium doosanense]AIT61961.1 excisionase [Corynebacterium doosanense CAU 212 = DSM 45436]